MKLTQHVQEEPSEGLTLPKCVRFRKLLRFLGRQKQKKHQMNLPELLAGRFLAAISQRSSATVPPDQRAQLLALLGIRSEEPSLVSEESEERLIASLSHIDEKQRIDAAHTIADLYERLSAEKQMHARVHLILMMWRDASMVARIAAIKALGRIRMPDTSVALQIALRDEEHHVRAAAASALGNIRGPVPVTLLTTAAMREQEHWSVRAAILQTMGESRERAFLNTVNLALDDEDASIRVAAIHALALIEGLRAAPRLALIAQRDRQLHVRHAAILELEELARVNSAEETGDHE